MPIAIPALAVLIGALLALCLYYGAEAFGKAIVHFTPSIGIPGLGNLKDIVRNLVDAGLAALQHLMRPLTHAATDMIGAITSWCVHIIGGTVTAVHDIAAALVRVVEIRIPHAIERLRAHVLYRIAVVAAGLSARIHALRVDAFGWVAAARAYARGLVAAAAAAAAADLERVRATVLGRLADLRADMLARVAGLAASVAHEFTVLRSWAAQNILRLDHRITASVAAVEADIADALHAAEHYATAAAAGAVRTAISDVDLTAVAGISAVGGLIIDEIPALVDVIGDDLVDIGAAVRAIPTDLPLSLADALALVGTVSLAATRYLRECGVPNCRNLSHYGRYLRDLLAIVGGGALLAALVEAIEDPEAAAESTFHALDGVIGAGIDEFRSLAGV